MVGVLQDGHHRANNNLSRKLVNHSLTLGPPAELRAKEGPKGRSLDLHCQRRSLNKFGMNRGGSRAGKLLTIGFDQAYLNSLIHTTIVDAHCRHLEFIFDINSCPRQCLASFCLSLHLIILGICSREETLQDVPDVEIESNWDQVVDK